MDHHIGRLLDSLDAMHLSENTIVLFLSDNGPAFNANALTDEDRKIRYVNGLRGHKGNIWENGIRSPLFVRWEGRIDPAISDRLSGVSDLFPTLLELAGNEKYEAPDKLDGRSIVPVLQGEEDQLPEREIFLYANPGWPPNGNAWTAEGINDEYRPWKFAGGDNLSYEKQIMGIRSEHYKLLFNPGPTDRSIEPDEMGYVLVNITEDPREKMNTVAKEREQFEEMQALLEKWYKDVFESEHAFGMPRFQIGAEPSISYPVLAYAPGQTSPGVKNASNYITNFALPDDYAIYSIDVEEPGNYDLRIAYRYSGHSALPFEIEHQGAHYEFIINPDTDNVHIPGIRLSGGNVSFGLISQSGFPGRDLQLTTMQFKREEH